MYSEFSHLCVDFSFLCWALLFTLTTFSLIMGMTVGGSDSALHSSLERIFRRWLRFLAISNKIWSQQCFSWIRPIVRLENILKMITFPGSILNKNYEHFILSRALRNTYTQAFNPEFWICKKWSWNIYFVVKNPRYNGQGFWHLNSWTLLILLKTWMRYICYVWTESYFVHKTVMQNSSPLRALWYFFSCVSLNVL